MIKSSSLVSLFVLAGLGTAGCGTTGSPDARFDDLRKSVAFGNWKYDLRVEDQGRKIAAAEKDTNRYLRATLSIGNTKTKKSLLYSASRDANDYEAKYKYLSFAGGGDLYLQYDGKTIHPIGYLFEPSNGLSPSERLVYKFLLRPTEYKALQQSSHIEYWYTDRLVGLGKICFNTNN